MKTTICVKPFREDTELKTYFLVVFLWCPSPPSCRFGTDSNHQTSQLRDGVTRVSDTRGIDSIISKTLLPPRGLLWGFVWHFKGFPPSTAHCLFRSHLKQQISKHQLTKLPGSAVLSSLELLFLCCDPNSQLGEIVKRRCICCQKVHCTTRP